MNGDRHADAKQVDNSRQSDEALLAQQAKDLECRKLGQILQQIVVASTFTADALRHPLGFWMDALDIHAETAIAPYAQIMQELLNPKSLLSQNTSGFNVLLIRLEDWIRDRMQEDVDGNIEHIRRAANDLVAAIGVLKARTSVPMFVFLCPASASLPLAYTKQLGEVQRDLMSQLDVLANVQCRTHTDLVRLYPVDRHENPQTDRIAHIPYINEYFVAIATMLARGIAVLRKPRYKVLVVDCDNTLWKGVCGEDGAAGIELTPAHVEFQRVLVHQHNAGVLLCVCTKNNASDVEAVFREHPEMPLREEHLICSRANWDAKSSNLGSLSQELGLSLDTFILIDDSSLECAEVRAHCPSVLTLQFPETQEHIAHFLDHVWAFDGGEVTEEAKRRTAQYKENRARSAAREEAPSLDHFLASLELNVDVSPMQAQQLSRVAELIQRTNQFNLTGIRRSQNQIEALWRAGALRSLVVHVRDRFGDYGLVGAMFFRCERSSIDVDTFVLSCRALGRGVEQRIVNELWKTATQEGLASIVLRYRETPRNAPARDFLERYYKQFRAPLEGNGSTPPESVFIIPTEFAREFRGEAILAAGAERKIAATTTIQVTASSDWLQVAYRLSHLPDIVQEVSRYASRGQRGSASSAVPLTSAELVVGKIFSQVLGLDETAVFGDFFELGGDSLQAVQVVARIASVMNVELPLHEFLEKPTTVEVAKRLTAAAEISPAIQRVERSPVLPISWAQQRLWFIDQLEGGSAAYHSPLKISLSGELDLRALRSALDSLLERHESLRTAFVKVDGMPMQQIAEQATFALRTSDLTTLGEESRSAELKRQTQEETGLAFDLAVGPLIRGRLLKLAEDEHVLLITLHHIVSDGWSIGVLIRELGALYEANWAGLPNPLPPLPIQYADYAQWQRQWLTGARLQEQLTYWTKHLRGAPQLLELPTDRPRPAVQTYCGSKVDVALGSELTAELKVLSRRLNVTLAMILYTAWAIVLSRLSGQEDIVIGMPVANRRRTELEGLIGIFVNTLAVRVRLQDDFQVTDLLERVKGILLRAYAHQDAPFEQVVEALQPTRSLSHSPVFQVMFVLQTPSGGELQLPKLRLAGHEVPLQTARYDLTLELQESEDGLSGSLKYASDLLNATTVERWAGYLEVILHQMVREPQLRLSELTLMREEERRQVVELFNSTRATYPSEKLIHELFEEQVHCTPEAVAIACDGQLLTYAELNGKANQVARYLRGKGVGADQLVAICIDRSPEMLVGLLGILKSGGAYIPLDPHNPIERLEHVLADARPRVLLTRDRFRETFPPVEAEVITLDGDWSEIAKKGNENLDPRSLQLSARNLAYVIYTSGSTGKPKGVMVEHRNVVNYAVHVSRQFDVDSGNGSLICTSISFDLMLTGLYPNLLCGRTVHLCTEQRGLPNLVDEVLRSSNLAPLKLTPSHLSLLEQPLRNGQLVGRVRVLVLGGEPLHASAVQLWKRYAPETRVFNHYGPTEATVGCVVHDIGEPTSGAVPIGRPISNTQIYILDKYGLPVPIGVAGEIHIGGAGVARGYLNRQELTAERFVADPFSRDPQGRMYKTGDLGSWRPDGTIDYLGRNDQQVKIRGYRIELGEIEVQLVRHAQVKSAIVTVCEDAPGQKRLIMYVVPVSPSNAPSVEGLRAHLKAALPEYMVPSALIVLTRMPLTPNGKVDRRALPAPELAAHARRQYEEPRGEVEEVLAGVWQGLLRVEGVGRQDNFFELGGHSLLIVQMLEHLRRVGLTTEVRRVFESPTLADLAGVLTSDSAESFEVPPNLIPRDCEEITPQMLSLVKLEPEHIEQIVRSVPGGAANVQDIYPLAPLQEGILFHHLMSEQGEDAYIATTMLSVPSRERLDELIAALQSVIDHHDVLRTAMLWEHVPQPVQVVYRRATLSVDEGVLDLDLDPKERIGNWMRFESQRLDLRQAPLMRLRVAADPMSAQWYALLQLHHMAADATSLTIVISEVIAYIERRPLRLLESIPYRNHVAQALAYARKHDAEAFFRSKLGEIDEATLPFGLKDVHGDGSQIEEAREMLESALAQAVRKQARLLGVSAATVFHAAWGLVVARTSGRHDVVFGTVLLGRLQGSAGAQRILGMFINTLPLRLQLQGVTAKELVEQTQRGLVELLIHEQTSLALAQRCSGVAGAAPLFSALLNYRHSSPDAENQWSSVGGIRVLAEQSRTNYPLAISIDDMTEGFGLLAQTDRRIDPRRIINYLCVAVQSLVKALQQAPQTPALDLATLPETEQRRVMGIFNATQADYPQKKLIQELFEEQVERRPGAIAAVYQGRSLTYSELNGKANQLARYLRSQGVGPGDFIPVFMHRSLQMLVVQLAVLKSGGIYVPIDPELPVERQAFMIRDCGALRIVADDEEPMGLGISLRWINCAAVARAVETQAHTNMRVPMDPDPPAYVMYTSGSTGVPKGVVVPHHAVNRLAINNGYANIEPGDCIPHYSNPAFDASTFEVWGALLNGARVVIVPQSVVLEAERFRVLLKQQHVTILWMSVGLFNQYTETLSDVFSRLRYLIVGGDSLEPGAVRRVLLKSPPQYFLNAYGPTECTTFSTTHLIEAVEEGTSTIPIGRPIANAQIYILDGRRQVVPIGVAGEMFIGGAGVACGYLNRPELTAERFIPDPFSSDPQARLYRTGDLARWRPDGVIDFMGRNDHQVKIRGFRIELGEIEARLAQHARVNEAVVLARDNGRGEKRLVAYVVLKDQSRDLAVAELRAHLKAALPDYLVPSAFVTLESMPLTSTGKVNRAALPQPELGAYMSHQYEAPQGEVEEALVGVWQEVLGLDHIGRRDNFFDLGGHSLLALQLLSRMNGSLSSALRVTDIYKCPTIVELAARVRAGASDDHLVDLRLEATLDESIVPTSGPRRVPEEAILLTGGTGFVGRFLLAQLLQKTNATIYCLVRAATQYQAQFRLRTTLAKWDLWHDEFEPRIVAIAGDLRLPGLGIDASSYEALSRDVDNIYHCATSMNHLETYTMAKATNVESSRELLKLATHRKLKLINYISTLGVFSSAAAGGARVVNEESPIDHERHWDSRGYAASKWVGEKIFMTAAERGIPCNIFRLGLVWADTQQGRYDELQREYRVFKSCLMSGYGIRNYRYDMAPTPVDYVARAVVFLGSTHDDGRGIFHISSSSQMPGGVFERCNEITDASLELVPIYDWIREMRRLHHNGRSLPAVPLTEFAFSMDEEAFHEHQRNLWSAITHFDCTRTHRLLEQAGIAAPALNDGLLRLFVESMMSRDVELRELADQGSKPVFVKGSHHAGLESLSGSGG